MSELKARILLNKEQLAEAIQCHPRHVFRMEAEGKIPKSVKIGQLKRWDASVIDKWIADGCPRVEGGDRS